MKRLRSHLAEAGGYGTGIVPDGGMRCKAACAGCASTPPANKFAASYPALLEMLRTALDLQVR